MTATAQVGRQPSIGTDWTRPVIKMVATNLKTTPRVERQVAPAMIKDVVRQIADRFDPQRIVLFGSHAYGQPGAASDVDMLVIMDTPLKETEQAVRICQAINYHFGLDLIVRKPSTIDHRLALGDAFLAEILNKGKVLYERAND